MIKVQVETYSQYYTIFHFILALFPFFFGALTELTISLPVLTGKQK